MCDGFDINYINVLTIEKSKFAKNKIYIFRSLWVIKRNVSPLKKNRSLLSCVFTVTSYRTITVRSYNGNSHCVVKHDEYYCNIFEHL